MAKMDIIINYLKYLKNAQTKFDIHSPFLFDLLTKVFDDNTEYAEYNKVEKLKTEILQDKTIISVTDLGAGSKVDKGNQRSISRIAKNSSKSQKIGRFLFRLAKYFQADNILELGTSVGLGSMYLALANPGSKIITIEGCPNISKIAKENFKNLEIENIEVQTGNFDDVLPPILESAGNFDFVFIDGNHREEPTKRYFELCLDKVTNETIFVFDDIHWSEGMENAWQHIQNHSRVTLTVDIFHMGLAFIRQELTKEHFVIRY